MPERWITVALGCTLLAALAPGQTGVPRPDHVVVVIEENKSFQQIFGSTNAPYINSLASRGALFLSYYAIRHPSQPNYLALFAGSTKGLSDDSCPHTYAGPNLGTALIQAGLTFAGYSESMPREGYKGCEAGAYARKHNPWVNFSNVPDSANRTFASFPANFSDLPTVAMVVPNLDNDMHDGPVRQGDDWLRVHLDSYVEWAQRNNSLFILTWDEGHSGNQILTLMVGPMVQPGHYCERIDHYNLLRTVLDMYGLEPFEKAVDADAITSAWLPAFVHSPVSVTIASPPDGASFPAPASFVLRAEATSSNGPVRLAEFFDGGVRLGSVTGPPFELAMNHVAAGIHCYGVKVTDAAGARRTSASIQVEIFEVPSPFPPAAGSYSGLFFETNRFANDHAGSVQVSVSPRGSFTARLVRAGRATSASGAFALDGTATASVGTVGTNQLQVDLQLGLAPNLGSISGRVRGTDWEAPLLAFPAGFSASHPTSLAGRYTSRLRGSSQDGTPNGDGVMAASVQPDGKVALNGFLADGTPLAQRAVLSAGGDLALFRPLYRKGGSILGWLKFTNNSPDAFGGDLAWTKTAASADRSFPQGFEVYPAVVAARYSLPDLTNRLAAAADLQIAFRGAALPGWTNHVTFSVPKHQLTDGQGTVLTLDGGSGLWKGFFIDPATRKSWPMRGTVIESENFGAGHFLAPNGSGAISFESF